MGEFLTWNFWHISKKIMVSFIDFRFRFCRAINDYLTEAVLEVYSSTGEERIKNLRLLYIGVFFLKEANQYGYFHSANLSNAQHIHIMQIPNLWLKYSSLYHKIPYHLAVSIAELHHSEKDLYPRSINEKYFIKQAEKFARSGYLPGAVNVDAR